MSNTPLTASELKAFNGMKEAFEFLDTPEDPMASTRQALEFIEASRIDVAVICVPA